jgi:hypothetical protein
MRLHLYAGIWEIIAFKSFTTKLSLDVVHLQREPAERTLFAFSQPVFHAFEVVDMVREAW